MIAIAIDDEPIALDIVKSHSEKVPYLELKGVFTNAFEALAYLNNNPVDLIFLDIKMPDISGIDFLKTLINPPMVVFTTAYSEHAVQSFELDAIDYLLKPFSLPRFLKACNKARELFELRNNSQRSDIAQTLFIKDGYEQIKIDVDHVLFAEAAGNYTRLHLDNAKPLSTRMTISDVLLLLPPQNFVRTHRAYIVAKNKIQRFDRAQIYINEHVIPIGPSYAQCIKEFL